MRQAPQVTTTHGVVQGAWVDSADATGGASSAAVFRGIPYAQAPVGALRFALPHAPASWDGVRTAHHFGPTPQRRSPYDPPRVPEPSIPGEETLTVNVTTPSPGAASALPVMVWIHGGGFIGGSPASPWYVGESFARDGVVTVTFGYRLGFEGFGWVQGAPVNRGIHDWLSALRWVQANIAAFGGDPSKVTIAGQSAGGAAVMRLLTMNAAQGLFRGAMAISPADASSTADATRAASARIAAAVGCGTELAEVSGHGEDEFFDARDHALLGPAHQVAGLAQRESTPLALGPCVDGDLVKDSVTQALRRGVGADVPLYLGCCSHEFNQLIADRTLDALSPAEAVRATGLSEGLAARYAAESGDRGGSWAVGQVLSDAIFRAPVARWAQLRSAQGSPTWVYDFRWESRSPSVGGAGHCLDLPFGFDILGGPGVEEATGEAPQSLADAVHADWLAMITTGAVDAPRRGPQRQTIVYGADASRSIGTAYEREEELWAEVREE